MSIQLMVCTPLYYFEDILESKQFVASLYKKFGIQLNPKEKILFFSEDLPSTELFEIDDMIQRYAKDIQPYLSAGLYLPCFIEDVISIPLPQYEPNMDTHVTSADNLLKAVNELECIIKSKVKNFQNYQFIFSCYGVAVKKSIENKQPIFWSY